MEAVKDIDMSGRGMQDDDLLQVIGESRGASELSLCIQTLNIANNKITHRGVVILANHQWDNLTILDLGRHHDS